MTNLEIIQKLQQIVKEKPYEYQAVEDLFEMLRIYESENKKLAQIGFQIVSSAYFQAVGKPKQSMLLSLSRQVLLLIPMILILPKFMGLMGLFTAGPVADLSSSILTAIFLFYELKHLDEKKEAETLNPEAELGKI